MTSTPSASSRRLQRGYSRRSALILPIAAFCASLALVVATSAWSAEDPWRAIICHPGYSATLRLPTGPYRAMRAAAFAAAGIPVSQQCHKDDPRPDCVILDHILPLELCTENCNDPSNLQVQLRADAEAKDQKENLHRWRYCVAKSETLPEARSYFHRSTR